MRRCSVLRALKKSRAGLAAMVLAVVVMALVQPLAMAAGWTLIGWNNLGMHCMDADFQFFSVLPPYNTIHSQIIDSSGNRVTNPAGITVTYEAIADPAGSINTTSQGKTNFWQFVQPLFGASPAPDMGLAGWAMPTAQNVPQTMDFISANLWFKAEGIPITPYDDAFKKNNYPLMRMTARDQSNVVLATTDIVVPVSDEMDCRACHSSGSDPQAQPPSGWAWNTSPGHDVKLNVLLIHDAHQGGKVLFQSALAAKGYDPAGLYATVTAATTSVLCAACHPSEALAAGGFAGVPPLTQSMHGLHKGVTDPSTGLTLDAVGNRNACYRCHPGQTTQCLRGAMGNAVAADGTRLINCQNCHGQMSNVGSPTRRGWLNEPNCQACHTGTATHNNGQIRYTDTLASTGQLRQAVDATFATNPDAPATGLSLYRFSTGHGGLYCQACHGSQHAEFPSREPNDNIQSIERQGHPGMLVECTTCHSQPNTVTGGPHGIHPVGQTWIGSHSDAAEAGRTACQACHGTDYRGTVLSRSQADRTLSTSFGSKPFWRGFQIGCYACHNGPNSDTANSNRPPVVTNASVSTTLNTAVTLGLNASDPDGNPLSLRIVSQAAHGTVGLTGNLATYYPSSGFTGQDSFTFAAWDGSTNSNLGTVTVTVGGGGCTFDVSPTVIPPYSHAGGTGTVTVTAPGGCAWSAGSNVGWITLDLPASGSGNGSVTYHVAVNNSDAARAGTLTVAGQALQVTQDGLSPVPLADLTGSFSSLSEACGKSCTIRGSFTVLNQGTVSSGPTAVEYYLSTGPSLGDTHLFLKRTKVKRLSPGQEVTKNITLKTPKSVTSHGKYVIAVIDPAGLIAESDKVNNVIVYGPLP
jgi:hypothetical protein